MRLLIVEDEPFIAADLESLALGLAHEVVAIADTKVSALNVASTRGVDAALVDLKLRDGFTGMGIASVLGGQYGLPFAFVTGNPELIPEGALGAAAVVQKPFSDARIAEVLAVLAREADRRCV